MAKRKKKNLILCFHSYMKLFSAFYTHFALWKFRYLVFGNNYLGIRILFGNFKFQMQLCPVKPINKMSSSTNQSSVSLKTDQSQPSSIHPLKPVPPSHSNKTRTLGLIHASRNVSEWEGRMYILCLDAKEIFWNISEQFMDPLQIFITMGSDPLLLFFGY